MSDAEDRVRAFLDAKRKLPFFGERERIVAWTVDGDEEFDLLHADLEALLARPSLSVLRDVAMLHDDWGRELNGKERYLCRCGFDLNPDQVPFNGREAHRAHQLAMMEAAR